MADEGRRKLAWFGGESGRGENKGREREERSVHESLLEGNSPLILAVGDAIVTTREANRYVGRLAKRFPMRRILALSFTSLALTACQTTAGAPPPPASPPIAQPAPSTPAYVTPASFALPQGAGCSGEIARFRAVIDNDLATGHVAREVHASMVGKLRTPETTCAAGQTARASAELRAVRVRHGYP